MTPVFLLSVTGPWFIPLSHTAARMRIIATQQRVLGSKPLCDHIGVKCPSNHVFGNTFGPQLVALFGEVVEPSRHGSWLADRP